MPALVVKVDFGAMRAAIVKRSAERAGTSTQQAARAIRFPQKKKYLNLPKFVLSPDSISGVIIVITVITGIIVFPGGARLLTSRSQGRALRACRYPRC